MAAVFLPTEVQIVGDASTGDVIQRYRQTDGSVVAIRLTPDLIGQVLAQLLQSCAGSPHTATRKAAEPVAIQSIEAEIQHGIATLRYELACGIFLQTTIGCEKALELSRTLSKARPTPTNLQ